MIIERKQADFRPVVITLETADDVRKLLFDLRQLTYANHRISSVGAAIHDELAGIEIEGTVRP